MKLSPTQQDVVLRMADGARLYSQGGDSRFFLTDRRRQAVPFATVWELEQNGITTRIAHPWHSAQYVLTDAGREEASRIRDEEMRVREEDLLMLTASREEASRYGRIGRQRNEEGAPSIRKQAEGRGSSEPCDSDGQQGSGWDGHRTAEGTQDMAGCEIGRVCSGCATSGH